MKFRNLVLGLILLLAGAGLLVLWMSGGASLSPNHAPPPASGSQPASPPDQVAQASARAMPTTPEPATRTILPPSHPPVAKAAGGTQVASAAPPSAGTPAAVKLGAGLHFAPDPLQGKVTGLASANFFMITFSRDAPNGATVGQLKSRPPIAVYDLSAAAIMRGADLDSLPPDGLYLYLLEYSGNVIGWVEANSGSASLAEIKSFSLSTNQPLANALANLLAMPQFQTGSYEVRLLAIGGGVRGFGGNTAKALWLKADAPGAGYIYTPEDFPNARIGANKLYTSGDFMSLLNTVATRRGNGRGARSGPAGAT